MFGLSNGSDPVGMLMGMKVYRSQFVPEFTSKRVRVHARKRWDRRGTYHRRIDKKWARRYGVTRERQVLRTPQGLFMHPGTWNALRMELGRELDLRPDARTVVDAFEDGVMYGRGAQLSSVFRFDAVLNPARAAAMFNFGGV